MVKKTYIHNSNAGVDSWLAELDTKILKEKKESVLGTNGHVCGSESGNRYILEQIDGSIEAYRSKSTKQVTGPASVTTLSSKFLLSRDQLFCFSLRD